MCCNAKWKREIVPDHKFDFLNVQEYHSKAFFTRIRYVWLYIMVLITVGVYCANIYTAVTMLVADGWTNSIFGKCGTDCEVKIPVDVGKWIFVGCIIFSFLLLGYETYKAKKVIASRDISYAFTNIMANGYYSLRSYPHFCFFCQINNSTKKTDDFAFFIFFTFKGWKHLLLADAPRQVISALTLYSFAKANNFQTDDLSEYYDGNWVTATLLVSMIFTVIVFAANMVLLIAAAILYVPLLCYIQGNLKEYCCHKIDKRIAELIKRKQRQRIARNAAMEKRLAAKNGTSPAPGGQGSYAHQPTLPNVSLDEEDEDMSKPFGTRGAEFDGAGGAYGGGRAGGRGDQDEKYWAPEMPPGAEDYHGYGPPPMPKYQPSPADSSYQPPSRNPSYPLHSQLPLQQQRLPDSYASSSTLGSYDLHQPPLDYNNNPNNNFYPQQSSNNPYPSSQDQYQQQHDLTRSYSPSQSLYTSPPPPQQPLDYYSNDVSGQHRRNLTQDSLTSSENGAMVYASEQGGVAGMGRTREEERYYASPPPRGGSMYALDSDVVAGGSGAQQQQHQHQQPSTEGQGYPADYKALYRP